VAGFYPRHLISDGTGGVLYIGSKEPLDGIWGQKISRNGILGEVVPPLYLNPEIFSHDDTHKLRALCYPNPFNPSTTIEYALHTVSDVAFSIFDLNGRRIKKITYKSQQPGLHKIIWDGTDQSANIVSTGLYFGHLQIGSKMIVVKMVLVR